MERFFIFDKFNTYYDWRLILTDKSIEEPTPDTKYINIDGMSGTLDLSEALTGEVTYRDRTISATFFTDYGNYKERGKLLRSIIASLHGHKIKIVEPDDPDHYFIGRVNIKSHENTLAYAQFTIEATCDPWRYAVDESIRPVSINNDTICVIVHNNGVKSLSPDIIVNGNVKIVTDDINVELMDGEYKIPDFKLKVGANIITLSGTGDIQFKYREVEF